MSKAQKNRPNPSQVFTNALNEKHRRYASVLPTITAGKAKAHKIIAQTTAPPADKSRFQWCETALLPMKLASEIAGVSITSLYRLADAGKLKLRTLAGRTLVDTKSLIALIDGAPAWTPTNRGAEARARRTEIAQASRAT